MRFLGLFLSLCLVPVLLAAAGDPAPAAAGLWKTFDEDTGEPKAILEIYEAADGSLEARVEAILKSERGPNPRCEKCPGERKNQPVLDMVILWDMQKDGENAWSGGRILDPQNGKVYKSKMRLLDSGELEVRGFIGFSLFGRSQVWRRVED